MKITREFAQADRYLYDFKICTTSKGWAQLDSRQDASYFGTWINPAKRIIFNYCEGDTTTTECDTNVELQAELTAMEAWNRENGGREFSNGKCIGIDPGFSEEIKAACMVAGLAEYLH